MSEILNGPSISKHDNPKKLIFMLHGYGDNAANFMHLAHPIDMDDWEAQYVALNGPGFIPGNLMGYQWFDLYPNGTYIAKAGPKEFKQIQPKVFDGNRRYYDKSNVDLLKKIKFLLKDQGMTINGVKKLLNSTNSNDLDEISNKTIRADNLRNKISNISKIIKDLKNLK